VGNDVYNGTGYHQTKTVPARRKQTRTFYVRVYNDGDVKDTLHVFGSAAKAGSSVRYFSGSTDVTSALRSATGWKRTLAPGAYALVKVTITVGPRAGIGTSKPPGKEFADPSPRRRAVVEARALHERADAET
jgi:hypothetical protein